MLPATLITPQLTLRPLWAADAAVFAASLNDWEVARWLADISWPYVMLPPAEWLAAVARGWETGNSLSFAVVVDGQCVGACGLVRHPPASLYELGFWLARSAWGRGHASRLVGQLLTYAHEVLGQGEIASACHPANIASIRVHEKNGFVPAGTRSLYYQPLRATVPELLWQRVWR